MRRKLLLGLVAISGALTVVGSGFAAWYFNDTTLSVPKTISTEVTPLADGIGTLTDLNKEDTIKIVLDQGGYANKDKAEKGISIVKTTTDTTTTTNVNALTAKYTISVDAATNLVAAGITSGTFKVTYTLSENAVKYIDFASKKVKFGDSDVTDSTSTGDSFTCSMNVNFTTVTTSDYSLTASVDTSTTTDGVNALLKYKSKPTSKTSYESMSSDLENDTNALTVTYSFAANTPAAA